MRVLHLVGSAVSDFYCDLSRLYAQDCLDATADSSRYDFRIAYVAPDGRWRFPTDLSQAALEAAPSIPVGDAINELIRLKIDVMVPQMFCVPGMTHYRALFDLLSIPYLGNRSDVMALTANKSRAKAVVAAVGVRVPKGEVLRPGDQPSLVPPTVIKPVDTDNSLGLGLVEDRSGYDFALKAAFEHADEVLVEEFVALGREVRCGIVVRQGELLCLPLEEYNVNPISRPIRRYEDKIGQNQVGDLNLVAKDNATAWIVDTEDPLTERVWEVARQCHVALGCRDYSLFDFRIDQSGEPWFLEAGLYCSFAARSVISTMARAAGIALTDLFEASLTQALQRAPKSANTD